MNKKSLVTACLLAGAVFAAYAAPIPTITSIGTFGYGTDYTPGANGNVTWSVPGAHIDTYDFTMAVGDDVTAFAQVVGSNLKNHALAGNSGELQLYEGTYTPGHALSSYTLVDQAAFSANLDPTLVDHLAAGNYFLAVEGTTAGAKGGAYYLDVTAAVPEPANAALLLVGLALVGTVAKRRKLG